MFLKGCLLSCIQVLLFRDEKEALFTKEGKNEDIYGIFIDGFDFSNRLFRR